MDQLTDEWTDKWTECSGRPHRWAHAELSRHTQKCEREAARVGKCRETIEMQEGIISRLEGLLEQAVVDGRRLAEAEAEASRLQAGWWRWFPPTHSCVASAHST